MRIILNAKRDRACEPDPMRRPNFDNRNFNIKTATTVALPSFSAYGVLFARSFAGGFLGAVFNFSKIEKRKEI